MKPQRQQPWHAQNPDSTLSALDSSSEGLSSAEAARRLAENGPNQLRGARVVSAWEVLLRQFKNVLVVLLILAAAVSIFVGHPLESMAIAAILIFAICLGFIQEYRADRALEALRQMAPATARVFRDSHPQVVPAADVVAGDILILQPGDKVAADARLIDVRNIKMDESSLTGESVTIEKTLQPLPEETALADRKNLVFAGTAVSYGHGTGVVCATGMETAFGEITGLLDTIEDTRTPLQVNLDRLGRILALTAIAIILIIGVAGVARGAAVLEMLIFGIALAVAVVPEALPAVVTISLALGVQRMARRNALMRHLPTVETLGSTSVICSDKTGTLTRDEMTVRQIWVDDQLVHVSGSGYDLHGDFSGDGAITESAGSLNECLKAAALCNDARLVSLETNIEASGDPTELALLVVAAKAGLDKSVLESTWPRIDEIPFSSERQRMTTLHRSNNKSTAFSKGAPESILDSCSHVLTQTGKQALTPEWKGRLSKAADNLAEQALRVLAIARKTDTSVAESETGMTLLGLFGMIDPPRTEAANAISRCADAGIKPIMITGDHPATARAVARELGLIGAGIGDRVLTGSELEQMSRQQFTEEVESISVYARVAPEHKLRVIDAWQQRGSVVAMTGDGVNDAPALKKADVGIAMGITGTDVSKEAADMMLTDDNFASIVGAVEEGRGIFDNIKKYLMYLLSTNLGEIGLIAGALLLGLPLPLTAVQILYINLATDGLPALALAVDPPADDLMRRPPRDPRRGVFSPNVVLLIAMAGTWTTAVSLGLFAWALASGRSVEQAMTLTFVCLVLIELVEAYNFRSDRLSALVRPFSNRWLNLALIWELTLLGLILYLPILHEPFRTYSLSIADWAAALGAALTIFPVIELGKWLGRRLWPVPERKPPGPIVKAPWPRTGGSG